jgi:P pilus assembly chaperone PapD
MKAHYFYILVFVFLIPFQAVADLLVVPTRLTFEPRERTEQVTLINTGTETRTYKLEWLQQKQTEGIGYSILSSSGVEQFNIASPYIRFSPRRVRLAPGESQMVKLLLRRKADMEGSEYRSHLKFTALPPERGNKAADTTTPSGMSIQLDVLTSYTIPVVISNSSTEFDLTFSHIKFSKINNKNYAGSLEFTIEKQVARGAYGDMTLFFRADGNDTYVPVGYLNGVNMFHESKKISSTIAWSEKIDIRSGELKLLYKGIKEFKGKFEVEAKINI